MRTRPHPKSEGAVMAFCTSLAILSHGLPAHAQCVEYSATPLQHVAAGRANICLAIYACTEGSGEIIGLLVSAFSETVSEPSPGYFELGGCTCPGTAEICDNGVDEDCDGEVDEVGECLVALTRMHTQYLGKLSGPGRQELAGDVLLNMTGTDLGVSYEHNGKLNFLFGDTGGFFNNGHCAENPGLACDTSCPGPDCICNWYWWNNTCNFETYGFAADSAAYVAPITPSPAAYEVPPLQFHIGAQGEPPTWWKPVLIPGVDLEGFEVPGEATVIGGDVYVFVATDWACLPEPECTTVSGPHGALAMAKVNTVTGDLCPGIGQDCALDFVWKKNTTRFATGSTVQEGGYLYFFGAGPYRASPVYLARVALAEVENPNAWQYFRGLVGGVPDFGGGDEGDALPLTDDDCVGELSVRYHLGLNQYLMTYNCASDPPGIYLRHANDLAGPWSEPIIILSPDESYGSFVHQANCIGLPPGSACIAEDDGLSNLNRDTEWGGMYGPYMVPTWFGNDPKDGAYGVVYTLSSWNPYEVHLMRTMVGTPGATYTPPPPPSGLPDPLQNPLFLGGSKALWDESGPGFTVRCPYVFSWLCDALQGWQVTSEGIAAGGVASQLSQEFRVEPGQDTLAFEVIGGHAQVELWVNGELYRSTRARDSNLVIVPVRWDISQFAGRTVELRIHDLNFNPEDDWEFITVSGFRLE